MVTRLVAPVPSPPARGGRGQGEGGQSPARKLDVSRATLLPSPLPLSPVPGERGNAAQQKQDEEFLGSSSPHPNPPPQRGRERERGTWGTESALITFLLVFSPIYGLRGASADEPPLGGRPTNFTGAVGSFRISTSATPTRLHAQDPLLFVVRISGSASADGAPQRPNLKRIAEFSRSFRIKDLDSLHPEPGVWEFHYELKPLRAGVRGIPAIRFDYYKPGIMPPEKGYRTTYALAIALEVKPTEAVPLDEIPGVAVSTPDFGSSYEPVLDPDLVLRRDQPPPFPVAWVLGCALLAPPLACALAYIIWARKDGGMAKRARRQSAAARAALRALAAEQASNNGSAHGERSSEEARRVSSILTEYLSQRWRWPASEMSPFEVAARLENEGCGSDLAGKAAGLLRACDAARFGPGAGNGDALPLAARELVKALEDEWLQRFP
jgi:hypothetical protein